MQDVLAYIILGVAVAFLMKKYFFKKKGNCNSGTNCNCK